MQPEPVLISADSDRSVPSQLGTIRSVRGQVVAVVGTGTAPWIRRKSTELSLHRAHKIGSSRNSAIVTLDIPLHPQNVARAKLTDHRNSRWIAAFGKRSRISLTGRYL